MTTVPDASLVNIAKLLGGISGGGAYTHMACGTGSTAEATTATTIETEKTTNGFARAAVTATYEADNKAVWAKTWTSEADGEVVRQYGILTASSGGTLGCYKVMTADKTIDTGETFTGTVKITTGRPAA